jgi:SAM-dependent methyltransferase
VALRVIAEYMAPVHYEAEPPPGSSATSWNGALKRALMLPQVRGCSPDDPELLAIHARLIREKPFLRRLYADQYREVQRELAPAGPGPVLELGSGGGFLREVLPQVTTTDVVPGPGVDHVMRADALEAADRELAGIAMLNVFHHLPDPRAFLREAERVLRPGGRLVMVEPPHTPLWSFLYRRFSPEPYDARAAWGFADQGSRMLGANVPQAWIVFVRDRAAFEAEFPALRLVRVRYHTAFLYLLSGGISYRALVPGWSYPLFSTCERLLTPAMRLVASQMTVVVERART